MKAEQKILPDSDRLIEAAAEHFVVTARSAIAKRGVFYVALAGGSTPKGLYQKLATSPYIEQIDWARVQIFFGDERCVPATHDDSNFKMARLAMLDHLPIPLKMYIACLLKVAMLLKLQLVMPIPSKWLWKIILLIWCSSG